MNPQVEFIVKLRDASQLIADAANQYIETLAPPEVKAETATASELNFTPLKYEAQQGAKLGEFEIAHKANNLEDKWHVAYNILRNSNATIKDRYHGETYAYSYWLFDEDKIYRQKLKPKPPKT